MSIGCWVVIALVWWVAGSWSARQRGRATVVHGWWIRERVLIGIAAIGTFAIPGSWWQLVRVHAPALRLTGLILLVAGVLFALWARFTLGGEWSGVPGVKAEHRLITTGPYRLVRHPIYTALLTMLCGTWLTGTPGRFLFWTLAAGVLFSLRVFKEDELMAAQFGTSFQEWRQHTPALIPLPFRPRH